MRAAALALALAVAPASAEEEAAEGRAAPAFQLRAMNPAAAGRDWVRLDRFVGEEPEDAAARAVLLSFFASWCGPCRKEMPYLEELHRAYHGQGLRVLSVNIDREEPALSDARRMFQEARVTYPVLSDRFNLTARRYLGERSPLPSVFIIRRDGVIARIERGYGKDVKSFLLAEVTRALGVQRAEAAGK
ncbi:MAG TPA: TlpA disulfide reductase family protein [Anaeromyxobacteraceae bacterium]|jgi:thiol-disulfide isomerase/thioredoxin